MRQQREEAKEEWASGCVVCRTPQAAPAAVCTSAAAQRKRGLASPTAPVAPAPAPAAIGRAAQRRPRGGGGQGVRSAGSLAGAAAVAVATVQCALCAALGTAVLCALLPARALSPRCAPSCAACTPPPPAHPGKCAAAKTPAAAFSVSPFVWCLHPAWCVCGWAATPAPAARTPAS